MGSLMVVTERMERVHAEYVAIFWVAVLETAPARLAQLV